MSITLQAGSFLIVGGICTLLQYATLVLLVQGLDLSAPLASTIGYSASALVNFLLNHRFTFASRVGYAASFVRFAVVAACALCLTWLLMVLGVSWLGLHYLLAQILTTGVVLLWNFAAHRWWTFEAAGERA